MLAHPAYARRRPTRRAYGLSVLADKQRMPDGTWVTRNSVFPTAPAPDAPAPAPVEGADLPAPEPAPSEGTSTAKKALLLTAGAGGLALLATLIVAPTFIVGPWIVKAFKPEWSYGRRLGASLAFGIVSGTLVSVARGLGGVQDAPKSAAAKAGAESTPAPTK